MTAAINIDNISKNFRLVNDGTNEIYDREKLREFTRFWKAILIEKHHMQPGHSIGIGFPLTDIYYFGLLLAAADLGLRLVVLDISNNKAINMANPKVQEFMPMDLFVSGPQLSEDTKNYYESLSRRHDTWQTWDTYQVQHSQTWISAEQYHATPEDVLLLCTSSGTTDRPKKIQHTHGFLDAVSRRNSQLWGFRGKVVHVRNLHHGSSLATYFLPALLSDFCEAHYIRNLDSADGIADLVDFCYQHQINHCQLPYVNYIELFLKSAQQQQVKYHNLILYTLGYINPAWQNYLADLGNVKIISVFGCNETSGPIFTNCLSSESVNFCPTDFVCPDDFYQLWFNDQSQLMVRLPVYEDTVITMQDAFNVQGNLYQHRGRNDLVRINDQPVDLFWVLNLCQTAGIKGQLVVDRQLEKIYYADWTGTDPEADVKTLNFLLQKQFGNLISIDQHMKLCHDDFLFGTKLDHEMLRESFRVRT